MTVARDSSWRVGVTQVGFDGVWSQPTDQIAVFHDGVVVKVYTGLTGWFPLARLLAKLYIARHR